MSPQPQFANFLANVAFLKAATSGKSPRLPTSVAIDAMRGDNQNDPALSKLMAAPSLLTVPVDTAKVLRILSTRLGSAPGLPERYNAPPPPTCGAAIDVPEYATVPPPSLVERTLTPGAQMSTHGSEIAPAGRLVGTVGGRGCHDSVVGAGARAGRRLRTGIHTVVASSDRVKNAARRGILDRRIQRSARTAAETHVRDCRFDGIGGNPVDAGNHARCGARSVAPQNLDSRERRAGHDANDSISIVARRGRTRHVCTMPIAISIRSTSEIHMRHNVEILVRGVNAGVDDVDVHVLDGTATVACKRGTQIGVDSVDAPRHDLAASRRRPVGVDWAVAPAAAQCSSCRQAPCRTPWDRFPGRRFGARSGVRRIRG